MTARTATPSPSTLVTKLTEHAQSWPQVSLAPHAEQAVAVRLNDATIGVLYRNGRLDVPVPAPVRAVLVDDGLATSHPDGHRVDWVSAALHAPADVEPATLLLRLSYLYRRLLRTQDAAVLRRIRLEIDRYDLPPALVTTYEAMIAKRPTTDSLPPDASSFPTEGHT